LLAAVKIAEAGDVLYYKCSWLKVNNGINKFKQKVAVLFMSEPNAFVSDVRTYVSK